MSEVNERTQRTSLLRGPVTDIPGLTTYLAGLGYATTAYVDDEIGVALGIVASQYFPLAGGTLTGDLDMDAHDIIGAQTINAGSFLKGGLQLATEAFASNASNLVSGTVPDARLSANVARRDQANTFSANQNITGSLTTTDIIVSNSTSGGLHIVNSAMRLVRNVASLLLENQNTGWPIDLSHGNGGTINVVGEQGGLPTLGFSLTRNNRNPDVTAVRNATGPTLETRAAGGLKVCNADGSGVAPLTCGDIQAGNVQGTFRPTQFTVATLPSAAANTVRTVQVTDSSVDFPGNIGNTVAGGGSNNVDVKSNGTNWRITG